jgi:uncharacterized protein
MGQENSFIKVRFHVCRYALAAAGMSLFAPSFLFAAEMSLSLRTGHYNLPIESYKERQFRAVIRQQYDYSCGSAALATLLKYHYGFDLSEHDVLTAMYSIGDKPKILKEGFSLLDMKQYLASIGLRANGFRAPLSILEKAGIPAIVLINNNGYLHFVVIKGISKDMVLLGDPALGARVMERSKFEKMWNQILFVVLDDASYAKRYFNVKDDWHVRESPVFSAALSDAALSSFTVQISPTPNYFF